MGGKKLKSFAYASNSDIRETEEIWKIIDKNTDKVQFKVGMKKHLDWKRIGSTFWCIIVIHVLSLILLVLFSIMKLFELWKTIFDYYYHN